MEDDAFLQLMGDEVVTKIRVLQSSFVRYGGSKALWDGL